MWITRLVFEDRDRKDKKVRASIYSETGCSDHSECPEAIEAALNHAEHRKWDVRRISRNKAVLYAEGQWQIYSLAVSWSPDDGELRLECEIKIKLRNGRETEFLKALNRANCMNWSGAFYYAGEQSRVSYRRCNALSECSDSSISRVEGMIDNAIENCDNFFPMFQLVNLGKRTADDSMGVLFMETCGSA